ncbi:MAG TPA: hypothetical protein VFI45_09540, partial [Candidatus Acidoferrum sp.]|nr:hypothetical protein [Candidatus Acidoferrum sp.]
MQRDRAYVRQLLQKGTADAKIESVLQLSSRFASFSPAGDFHAYALSLIAKEKAALKQSKQIQEASLASQTAPVAAASASSSVLVSGNALAPSNPVGINRVKSSQESSRDNASELPPTSAPDSSQAATPNSSPAAFAGGLFLPTGSVPSNAGGVVQPTSVGAVSNSKGTTTTGGSSTSQSGNINTFNSDQGPGPGPIGPGPGCNLLPAPPSVGATVPLSYFGPSPSETNPSLVG